MTAVILEGPDNSGKSTLAKRLREVTGVEYYHPGGAPADVQAERAFLVDQHRLAQRGPIIMDRVTSISQQVYNPDPDLDQDRRHHADILVTNPSVFVVYCRPSNEHLTDVSNFTWRPEETEEHRQKIVKRAIEWVNRYDELMKRVPCLHYDFNDRVAAEVLETALIGALTEDCMWMQWLTTTLFQGGKR